MFENCHDNLTGRIYLFSSKIIILKKKYGLRQHIGRCHIEKRWGDCQIKISSFFPPFVIL